MKDPKTHRHIRPLPQGGGKLCTARPKGQQRIPEAGGWVPRFGTLGSYWVRRIREGGFEECPSPSAPKPTKTKPAPTKKGDD